MRRVDLQRVCGPRTVTADCRHWRVSIRSRRERRPGKRTEGPSNVQAGRLLMTISLSTEVGSERPERLHCNCSTRRAERSWGEVGDVSFAAGNSIVSAAAQARGRAVAPMEIGCWLLGCDFVAVAAAYPCERLLPSLPGFQHDSAKACSTISDRQQRWVEGPLLAGKRNSRSALRQAQPVCLVRQPLPASPDRPFVMAPTPQWPPRPPRRTDGAWCNRVGLRRRSRVGAGKRTMNSPPRPEAAGDQRQFLTLGQCS